MTVPHSLRQRGSADVWICLGIIAFLGFIGWVVVSSNNRFREDCVNAGGTPIIGRYDKVCYEPGAVKFTR